MGNLDDRLKRLEEALGAHAEISETKQRIKEKSALIFYAEGIHRSDGSWELAENLIIRYGSLQLALGAYRDVNEYNINSNALTKEETEELDRAKMEIRR